MVKTEGKTPRSELSCQKCHERIGGKAYYVVQLDCIYDGKSLTGCDRLVLCSECYHLLRTWMNLGS